MTTDSHADHERQHRAAGGVGAWTEISTLVLLAVFLGFSFFSGRLERFLVRPYLWLPPIAALILLAMGAARLIAHRRGKALCECERRDGWQVSRLTGAAILIVPIIVALWVNPRQFSPEGARKRDTPAPPRDFQLQQAINWVLGGKSAGRKGGAGPVSLPKDPTILDLLGAVSLGDPKSLEGRFVTVIGQCDLLEGPGSQRFVLYRLVVTCCIADATAVSIEVAWKPSVRLQPGEWVRAGGILKFDSAVDPSLPVVHAATVSPIAEPREPYL